MPSSNIINFIDIETSNWGIDFYPSYPTHDDHRHWHEIVINVNDIITQKPVQLNFEFYNERHHKPKKRKKVNSNSEYLCPF